MPRIFKGTVYSMKLYLRADDITEINSIRFFTTDSENYVEIIDNIRVVENTIEVEVYTDLFENLEDGVITYIASDDNIIIQRQSQYYLKTPIPTTITGMQYKKDIVYTENGNYKILPDEGFKAISEVDVEVNIDTETHYWDGYNQGHEVGFEEGNIQGIETGKQEQKDLLEPISITENGTYTREDGYNQITVEVPDLNGSFDEGYTSGYNAGNADGYESGYESGSTDGYNTGNAEGYETGYNVGVAEQKSKLESISITENGTYSREDGYNQITVEVPDLNGSFDEGYTSGYTDGQANGIENAGTIIAETARVINITENGKYASQYTEPELITTPTGIYNNGDLFFDYAFLNDIVYQTNILPNSSTKIELWWKYNDNVEGSEGCLIGSHTWGKLDSIFKIGWNTSDKLIASIYGTNVNIPFISGWNHIVMSYADGLYLNNQKIGDFTSNITDDITDKVPICINGYYNNTKNNSDYFGMIKIDDTVIIPTENGLLNINTNELLTIKTNGEYNYTNVIPEYKTYTGEFYKTINVDVIPKISIKDTGLKFGFSKFKEIPEWADFDGVTDMDNMFYTCQYLTSIPENFDTSSVTDMENMFNGCSNLTSIPENFDTSNVVYMQSMFNNCPKLTSIPELNTSNVTTMQSIFASCSNLTTISPLDCSSIGTGYNSTAWFGFSNLNNLTDIGGFINLKISSNTNYGLQKCPNLTYESCINILNGLYDFTGNGEIPTSSQGKLKVHQNFLDLVGDEISIGTSKGWTISA